MSWPQFWTYHVLLGEDDLAVITRLWMHAANEEVNRREGPNSAGEVQVVTVTTSQQVVLTEQGVFMQVGPALRPRTVRLEVQLQPPGEDDDAAP